MGELPLPLQEWKQKAFNGAWRGLKWQGFQSSWVLGTGCAYRSQGMGGRRCCAVGWLIPDSNYSGELENLMADDGLVRQALSPVLQPVPFDASNFLVLLQRAHDRGKTPAEAEQNLRYVATLHSLKIPDAAA